MPPYSRRRAARLARALSTTAAVVAMLTSSHAAMAEDEEEESSIETFIQLGLEGLTIASDITGGAGALADEISYGFTIGRSVQFSLHAADTFAVGLALDFAGLDLGLDLRRLAASLAVGPMFFAYERLSIAGDVLSKEFSYPYQLARISYGTRGLLHGAGLLIFEQPRLAEHDDGTEYLDRRVEQLAVGYTITFDSMLRTLEQGYVTGGLYAYNDHEAKFGMLAAVDTMALIGLAFIEPSPEFAKQMEETRKLHLTGSTELAFYSQAEALFLVYKEIDGWIRLAGSVGFRARLVSTGGKPNEDLKYYLSLDFHVGPFLRVGAMF